VPLVFVTQTYDDDDNNSISSTYRPTTFSPPASVTPPSNKTSPPAPGTPKFLGFSLRGKKTLLRVFLNYSCGLTWLLLLLQSSRAKYKSPKQDLFVPKLLTGYGIACTGNGMVGIPKW